MCEALVREMSEEDFKKHRQAVIARIMEKDDHLAQETGKRFSYELYLCLTNYFFKSATGMQF